LVDVVRTPLARRNGALSGWHPADLLGATIQALAARTGLVPDDVDDVIVGCVTQVGAQSTNIARNAVLSAGWPEHVPGTTIDRQCGSAQQAVHFAAQGVMAGAYDVAIAAGVESMSVVPMFSNAAANLGDPYGPQVNGRYSDVNTFGVLGLVPQGLSAELVAQRYGLDRTRLDAFAAESQRRAAAARDGGRFDAEIVTIPSLVRSDGGDVSNRGSLGVDSGIRETSVDLLATLPPVFRPDGIITAGNSSQISDGAAAALIVSERYAVRHDLGRLAQLSGFALAGCDPIEMLTAPIPATENLLRQHGLAVDDIDLFEINEAFAPVVLAWADRVGVDLAKVNVNGGAIALGHPLGATGVRILATLTHELIRRGGGLGVQTICEGGGMANALLVEVASA
jgi:acetyl-CoA acetyltransferase family protein